MKKDSSGKRKAEVSSLKDCISELLDAYRLRGKFSQTQIISSWEKLMGQPIAKRTTDIFFREGRLFVKLSSGPLKQELQLSKSKIIKMLNAEVGMDLIDDVIFL